MPIVLGCMLKTNNVSCNNKNAKIGYYVGCTASYRQVEVAIATAKIFEQLGVEFTLIEDEKVFEEKNNNILEKDNLEQTMFIFQLMLFSSNAQKHSEDMSNKIKKRVIKKGNKIDI